MSVAMDKALMAMSLEDDDVSFSLPDSPEFSSCERNVMSIVGRILNPNCQSVAGAIHEMSRKWQKFDKVRGIALSKEKFQIIFSSEHDLEDVLQKGLHTHNESGIVVERWSEILPPNSLQFMTLWVQIRNIPINHYTATAITSIGEIIGQVIQVDFDPDITQANPYVRAQICFDVSKPLRNSKIIGLPHNQLAEIYFYYERVQKRCYSCQRLSHELTVCPLVVKSKEDLALARRRGETIPKPKPSLVIKETDPLFGVLGEHQVGINPLSGRPRIAPEVLEGMRQYLLTANGEELVVKEERVKKSVAEAEKSPFTQKSALSLEPVPRVSHIVDIGKGRVFGYESNGAPSIPSEGKQFGHVRLEGCLNPFADYGRSGESSYESSFGDMSGSSNTYDSFKASSSVYRIGFSEASPSGSSLNKKKPRKRQQKKARILKGKDKAIKAADVIKNPGLLKGIVEKRKAVTELEGVSNAGRAKTPLMVPKEGLSNI